MRTRFQYLGIHWIYLAEIWCFVRDPSNVMLHSSWEEDICMCARATAHPTPTIVRLRSSFAQKGVLLVISATKFIEFHYKLLQASFINGFNPRLRLLFHHTRPHLGGWGSMQHHRLVCPLIATELCKKHEREARNVLNPAILDFTTIGQILTLPGQVKQKMFLFGKINAFANNFWTREDGEKRNQPRKDTFVPNLNKPRSFWILRPQM